MKYVIFGGFDYAVPYEMNQNALEQGIDYFVDNDPNLVGTRYLGKEIKHPNALLEEDRDHIYILIGSVIHRAEIEFQLRDMGFKEEKDYIWALAFNGDDKCERLWTSIDWNDREKNSENLKIMESAEYPLARMKVALHLVDINKYEAVVDLGAANERLKTLLPDNIKYIPVDCIRYSSDTIMCDFNKYQFPQIDYESEKTCIFSIGCIGYCKDWKWYLRMIAQNCSCFILANDDVARINREYRKKHWLRQNAIFDYEIIMYMQSLGFVLTDGADFRLKSVCYKFERGQ